MPQINLCFLWHMHQPFYKDLASGEYKLPWTRMHALKDYYGMVRILEEFPKVKQTFNLVPSMMAQVEEYAAGAGARPVSRSRPQARREPDRGRARAPAAALLLLRSGAHDLPLPALRRALRRAQRTEEIRRAQHVQRPGTARRADVVAARLVRRGVSGRTTRRCAAGSSAAATSRWTTSAAWAKSSARSWATCCRRTRRLAATGPDRDFHHAVLPSHPAAAVRFQHRRRGAPQRAAAAALPLSRTTRAANSQLAREYVEQHFGVAPVGLWPSEGSVSDEVFALAAELGFEWAATDSGVLDRTQQRAVPVEGLYRPYEWRQGGNAHAADLPRPFHERPDRLRLFQDGAVACRRRFPASHPPELRRHSGRRPRCPGADHPGRRERLGILSPQRPPLPARTLPAHQRRSRDARRDRQRSLPPDGARAAGPHLPGLLDQRQFRYLDRRRGRQPGLDPVAARARHLRRHHRRPGGPAAAWRTRNC